MLTCPGLNKVTPYVNIYTPINLRRVAYRVDEDREVAKFGVPLPETPVDSADSLWVVRVSLARL